MKVLANDSSADDASVTIFLLKHSSTCREKNRSYMPCLLPSALNTRPMIYTCTYIPTQNPGNTMMSRVLLYTSNLAEFCNAQFARGRGRPSAALTLRRVSSVFRSNRSPHTGLRQICTGSSTFTPLKSPKIKNRRMIYLTSRKDKRTLEKICFLSSILTESIPRSPARLLKFKNRGLGWERQDLKHQPASSPSYRQ